MNATNEQMAEVMGWIPAVSVDYWKTPEGTYTHAKNDFQPTTDLNHTALVEARLRELGIVYRYYNTIHAEAMLTGTDTEYLEYIISAGAQTRCNAARKAYSAWKEGQK